MGFFFEEIFHLAKTTEFSLSVATGTEIKHKLLTTLYLIVCFGMHISDCVFWYALSYTDCVFLYA
jgi:hypothetical protein